MEELRRLQNTPIADRDRLSILYEISVYQEELVVQNEALSQAQATLEHTRDRYIELYDFAPSGYVTLDENGVIREINLTAAALLGKSKGSLEGLPFMGLVVPGSRNAYFAFLRKCRQSKPTDIETELTLQSADGPREVQLVCRLRHGPGASRECFTALVDVTDRRRLERERDRIAQERAALTSRLISAQEDERLRIARNLHDDLGQRVTALRLRLEALVQAAAPTRAEVEQLQGMLQQFDERLHGVASELRPSSLDLGIVAALGQFLEEWSETAGVPAGYHSKGIKPGTLLPHLETHLYRIAQEVLNNVAKHASASHVAVLLEARGDDVLLVVEDDGRGFELEGAGKRRQGLGLAGVRERAQTVGGQMKVETSPGHGTKISVRIPHDANR